MKAKHLELWKEAENYLGTSYEGYYVVISVSDESDLEVVANYQTLSRHINGEDCIEASFGGFMGKFKSILLKQDSPLVSKMDKAKKDIEDLGVLDDDLYDELRSERWFKFWNETGSEKCAKEIKKVLPELENKIFYINRDPYDMEFFDKYELLVEPLDLLNAIKPFACYLYAEDDYRFGFESLSTPQRSNFRDALMLLINRNWVDGVQLELELA